MAEGEFALLKQHLEAALHASSRKGRAPGGDHDLYAMLVDAAAQQRDQAALREYAPLAEETARSIDHKLHLGIADRAWGVGHTLAGEFRQAEARLRQALELFTAYPARWQINRTVFEMGQLARAEGKTEQARDFFSKALEGFEELRAAPYAMQARAALDSLGHP